MPTGKATATERKSAATASSMVAGRRSAMSWKLGTPWRRLTPKSW